jgi:hypothetical protein
MKWLLFAIIGVSLNGAGLCFFGNAVLHRTIEPGAINAWFWDGTLSLILINAGICFIVEAAKWRGRD